MEYQKQLERLAAAAEERVWVPVAFENKALSGADKQDLIAEHLKNCKQLNESNIKKAKTQYDSIGKTVERFGLHIDASKSQYEPPSVVCTGKVGNVVQAHVRTTGAESGESNFKKQQKPTKHGYKQGCDLGTYVMNMHTEVTILDTQEIDPDARIMRYGKWVKKSRLSPQDRIFAEAAKKASLILEMKAADQSRGTESEQSGTLSGKRPDA